MHGPAARLIAVLLLASCAHERPCEPTHTLYVVDHGWHSGVVLQAQALPALAVTNHKYVEIGWGEERFYPARQTSVGMALRAVLWPNRSVLQVVRFSEEPRRYFADVSEIPTDAAGYEAAAEVIRRSFAGDLHPLGRSLYGEGAFYRAEGTFHLLNNCHHWVTRVTDAARCKPIRSPQY